MITHALISPAGTIDRESQFVDPNVLTKKGFYWIPIEENIPYYDQSSEVLEGPSITIVPRIKVLKQWTVRPKTIQEVDNEKYSRIESLDKFILKILFDQENRLRTIEGKENLTIQQFKSKLKDIL